MGDVIDFAKRALELKGYTRLVACDCETEYGWMVVVVYGKEYLVFANLICEGGNNEVGVFGGRIETK